MFLLAHFLGFGGHSALEILNIHTGISHSAMLRPSC